MRCVLCWPASPWGAGWTSAVSRSVRNTAAISPLLPYTSCPGLAGLPPPTPPLSGDHALRQGFDSSSGCWSRIAFTRATPFSKKTIIAAEGAGCPVCSAAMEMADHLVFGSPFALAFWQKVGIVVEGAAVRALHLLRPGPVIGATSPGTFLQLCCWQLWKHCNSKKYIYRPRIMFILIKHVSTTYL